MKQLRLLLLMLVACVAQVSHGQDLFETWYEEGLIRERMIPVMLCFNDYQKYFGDIAQSLSGVHKYGSNEVLSVRQKEEYIQRHIDSVKGNLSKWQKKLEKGKSLNFEDALWGALVSQHDGVMAAKYFDAAVKVAKDDSTKTILQLASIGCKYSINKDKAAAAAAINFPIPDNCKKVATLIVNKYSMKDIPSEAIQQLLKVDKRLITRAIRSNNIEELKKYESYDIPEVDSVLALKTESEDLYWKCIMKHKMVWPLSELDYADVVSRTDLPANVFKSAFFTPMRLGGEQSYKMLVYITHGYNNSRIESDAPWIFTKLSYLRERSDFAALAMAVIINTSVWNVPENRDFFFDLNEYTAQLLGNNESEKAKSAENINKAFSDYFSINTKGVVKLKFQNSEAKVVELYEKLAKWICSSDIKDGYTPAEWLKNTNMDELTNILVQNVVFEPGVPFHACLTVDVDGSIISIDASSRKGNSIWKEGVSHNVKMQTKCKPAMRGGQPCKDVLKIRFIFH